MTNKDFWRNANIAVLGAGSFGTVLASLAASQTKSVSLWVRNVDDAAHINQHKRNPKHLKNYAIPTNVKAISSIEEVFSIKPNAVIWALPSKTCRAVAKDISKYFDGSEILIHGTKGLEPQSLKRISEVLSEEIPCPRIGVLSGPNLAVELSKGEPAAAVIASNFIEVIHAGQAIFSGPHFRIYGAKNMAAVEWAGTLKNILAIASGCIDELGFGWNTRSYLLTRGLAEMVRLSETMGGDRETFWGLSGIGDLIATCNSPSSRNYRVGRGLAQGKDLNSIITELGETAEGIGTTEAIFNFATSRKIEMPITESVYYLLKGKSDIKSLFEALMSRQVTFE